MTRRSMVAFFLSLACLLNFCSCASWSDDSNSSEEWRSQTEFDDVDSGSVPGGLHSSNEAADKDNPVNEGDDVDSRQTDRTWASGGPHTDSFLAVVNGIRGDELDVSVVDAEQDDAKNVRVQLGYLIGGDSPGLIDVGDSIRVTFVNNYWAVPQEVVADIVEIQ